MKIYRTLRFYERSLEKGIKQIINVNKFESGVKKYPSTRINSEEDAS